MTTSAITITESVIPARTRRGKRRGKRDPLAGTTELVATARLDGDRVYRARTYISKFELDSTAIGRDRVLQSRRDALLAEAEAEIASYNERYRSAIARRGHGGVL